MKKPPLAPPVYRPKSIPGTAHTQTAKAPLQTRLPTAASFIHRPVQRFVSHSSAQVVPQPVNRAYKAIGSSVAAVQASVIKANACHQNRPFATCRISAPAKRPAVAQRLQQRVIQLGVWKEGGTNAVAIPPDVKTLGRWIKDNYARLGVAAGIKNSRQMVIGAGPKWVYDRYKDHTYVGGDVFNNGAQPDNNRLPVSAIYKEFDVREYAIGVNRGRDRIVVSNTGKMYYTNNHYTDFTEFS
jgi:hypothetical protein